MYKVLRSYTKKAERKHELTRSTADHHHLSASSQQNSVVSSSTGPYSVTVGSDERHNGQIVPMDNRIYETYNNGSWGVGQGFSESSSFETREHFERKVQRVKKTRSERDSNRKLKKTKVSFLFSW